MARGSSEERKAHQERVFWGPRQQQLLRLIRVELTQILLCPRRSQSFKKHPGTWRPTQALGCVTPGNTCCMSRVWGRLHGNVTGYQRSQRGSSLLQFPPQGPGGGGEHRQPCSRQVWSITAVLLFDWPWQSFVVAPPESCGAAGRRRRTESAAY